MSAEVQETGTQANGQVALYADIPAPVKELMRDLDGIATPDDSMYASLSIMANILEAETEEDIFKAADAGVTHGEDFIDEPFLLSSTGIQWRKSAEQYRTQGGFPFYALMNVEPLNDELTGPMLVSCGGYPFVATLRNLERRGLLAKHDKSGGMSLVIKAKRVTSGYDVFLLMPYKAPSHAKK